MTQNDWQMRSDAALQWIRKSIEVTGGNGSAHSWHRVLGWSKAYPETTGYLIETLLNYAKIKQDESLQNLAIGCAKWLDTIQLDTGAFPGLLVGNTKPSVFNTSQILFAAPHLKGSQRALNWLISCLEPDGAWRQAAFVPGFVPSYYTRAIWAVLQANEFVQHPEIEGLMRRALQLYAARFLPNGIVQDWGFRPGAAAFTHTIAYTLEGFWEASIRLGETAIAQKTLESVQRLLAERPKAGGRTAGRYDADWKGDYSFVCVTGNCQLSVLCHKIWVQTGEPGFKDAATLFLNEILGTQKLGANKNSFGALPGSTPLWGSYLPLRYPNWATKFFLDAMARLRPEALVT
jgi:hypothetical protein